jgi:hypothetical protein
MITLEWPPDEAGGVPVETSIPSPAQKVTAFRDSATNLPFWHPQGAVAPRERGVRRIVRKLTPTLLCRLHIFRRPIGPGLRHSEQAWPSESESILELRPSLSAAALLKESMHG